MHQRGYKLLKTTSLVIHSRVPVFWPSLRRSGSVSWVWETPWGSVSCSATQRGLTGQHRRVLDAIFAYALDSRCLDTGALVLLVDPYRIDMATSNNGTPWLRSILDDLKHADVTVTEKNSAPWYGGIVSDWNETNLTKPLPGGALVGIRHLWAVTISAVWMRAFDSHLAVQYRSLLPILHSLRSGAAYALALMVISHREFSMQLSDALRHVMAIRPDMTRRACNKVIAGVLREKESFAAIGIKISDGLVRYQQHPDIRFHRVNKP